MISSHASNPSSKMVHFEGAWSESEQTIVEQAAAEVETATLPSMPGARQAPWVATCHDRDTAAVYAASRHGISRVVSARSAQRLADKIRDLELGGRSGKCQSRLETRPG